MLKCHLFLFLLICIFSLVISLILLIVTCGIDATSGDACSPSQKEPAAAVPLAKNAILDIQSKN